MGRAPGWAALGLGGNQGAPLAAFARALAALAAAGRPPHAVSRAYLSCAQQLPGARGRRPPDANFWNVVCLLPAAGSPEALLADCQALERAAGRRPGPRWGPRPLDIDLLCFGQERRAGEQLTLPHPRLAERPFVLWPLAELALDLRLPLGAGQAATPRQLLMAHPEPLAGLLEVHRLWPEGCS